MHTRTRRHALAMSSKLSWIDPNILYDHWDYEQFPDEEDDYDYDEDEDDDEDDDPQRLDFN